MQSLQWLKDSKLSCHPENEMLSTLEPENLAWILTFMFVKVLCCITVFSPSFLTEFPPNFFLHGEKSSSDPRSPSVSPPRFPPCYLQGKSSRTEADTASAEDRLGLRPFSWDVRSMRSLIAEQPQTAVTHAEPAINRLHSSVRMRNNEWLRPMARCAAVRLKSRTDLWPLL